MSRREAPQDWAEMDALFARVLERPAEERLDYLAGLRDVDAKLRAGVERLLWMHAEAESFLETPPLLSPESLEELAGDLNGPGVAVEGDEQSAAEPGQRIGAWRIVEPLGRGGMATVYLVERADGAYEQTAALKLLRRGLDTSDIVRRFRAERQILSSVEHPNISRLLDGGATEDGRPYLVMERVEGVPITEWCDAREASVEKRLRLFVEVARAVHHAHTRLVVHRDLKPSNILVTPDGRVKLLDFGIAKILDPDFDPASRVPTRTGRLALTPEYASPEQVRGDAVTTATDVYQLGLLLYRLLTGARPREARGASANLADDPTPMPTAPSRLAVRVDSALAEARDCTPQRLARRLKGDLDAIVLAAIEVEPEDRYPSALAIAEDVERHLQGHPIKARPAGRVYRARKLMARHRWLAPAVAAGCAVLGLYVGTLLLHGSQLEAERNSARRQAERAEHVRDVLVGVFQGADPWSAEETRGVSEAGVSAALDIGVERTRTQLTDDPELQADLYSSMAEVYVGLGHVERARSLLEDALERRRELHGPRSREVAATASQLGRVYNLQTRYDSASALLGTSLEIARERADVPDSTSIRAMIELGYARKALGHYAEAERLLLRAADASAAHPDLLARTYQNLAALYSRLDRSDDARRFAELAYALKLDLHGEGHPETAVALSALAQTLWLTAHEDFDEAIALQERAIEALDDALGPEHPRSLGAQIVLGAMLRSAGRLGESEGVHRRAVSRHAAVLGERHPQFLSALRHLAIVLFNAGKLGESEEILIRIQQLRSEEVWDQPGLVASLLVRCEIGIHRGDFVRAERLCREALRIQESADVEGEVRAIAECRLGATLISQDRAREAEELFDRALPALWESRTMHVPGYVHECLQFAARTYDAVDRAEEAASLRERASSVSRRGLPGVVR